VFVADRKCATQQETSYQHVCLLMSKGVKDEAKADRQAGKKCQPFPQERG
jgi:hypothetical protein